jgi:streptogramin lyase
MFSHLSRQALSTLFVASSFSLGASIVAAGATPLRSRDLERPTWRMFTPRLSGQYMGAALGLDGDVWVTAGTRRVLLRFEKSGRLSFVPTQQYLLGEVVRGASGDLYAVSVGTGGTPVVRISPSGALTPIALRGGAVGGITAGADGSVWVPQSDNIARIFPDGRIREYSLGGDDALGGTGVAEVPGGDVWFDADIPSSDFYLASLNPQTGRIRKHLVNKCSYGPMAAGADGRLWALCISDFVGVARDGSVVHVPWPPHIGTIGGYDTAIVGPDDAIWILGAIGLGRAVILRFDVFTRRFHVYVAPKGYSTEDGLTFDADGNLWASSSFGGQVHELTFADKRR